MGMRQRLSAVVMTIGLLAAAGRAQAATADDICHQLRAFEIAPFANGADGKLIGRSVTFIWSGHWLSEDMRWGCSRKKEDAASVALCAYLMKHTSLEFRASLPVRVLRCYGYSFPESAPLDWGEWKADITLHSQSDDRSLRLHVDLGPAKSTDGRVGISAVPDGASADSGSKPRAN
jgi:hypothetical protein